MTLEIIKLSDKAINQAKKLWQDQGAGKEGLRISVIGGGCSGLSYKIDFDQKKEKDNVMTFDNLRVFIDPKSSIYLKGVELDYQDGLQGKGFVFHNPSAKNTCGCGESFSV
jgi:iron-sulfur cluster assembly protein